MNKSDITYYDDYISHNFKQYLKKEQKNFDGIEGLTHIGESGGLENKSSMQFVCDLYNKVKDHLNTTLIQREKDRKFIDERVKAYYQFNQDENIDFLSQNYKTILGDMDEQGRIVIGPLLDDYCAKSKHDKVAPIPEHLKGFHVTLFGPPDDAKLSINAMNAYHRKLKEEPAIVEEILQLSSDTPKWGADDEDSKTPLRKDLISASTNLTGCFNQDIEFTDSRKNKTYKLEETKLSQPIKRFPGLALPCSFLFYQDSPIPLHLYDFALHLFEHWHNPSALTFYVPKLENEEEARYIKFMIETAEKMIQSKHQNYKLGTVRVIIVLENPRAVFRVNEMMDELYPYFAGASLGWHDYLGSTARLFKEDGNYRIPVKADPDIVIKYIKASHELLANVVGERGGIKIGGMYGILPIDNNLFSDSFQITIRGFFRDVLTQMKRDLSGYWVAHPDFIRIGIAIVQAWRVYQDGDESKLKGIINGLLNEKYAAEIWDFVKAQDIESLDMKDPMYDRALIVADIKESNFIANNHPDEIRYNVFQMLQYLTDWLSGNGCVALPTEINGIPTRVMDDLATAERSRWEVWHEITHGRFSLEEFVQIAHEEMNFIRRDLSNEKKIVQIKYTADNAKWYDVAYKLMLQLMCSKKPVEFATELLLPFTIDSIREQEKPWDAFHSIDPSKYHLEENLVLYNYYFEMCGAHKFANDNSSNLCVDLELVEKSIMSFEKSDVLSAASFHGDIGQNLASLDAMAKSEQAKVSESSDQVKNDLITKTKEYQKKYGIKYLVSAKGKSANELLEDITNRLSNSEQIELNNAKSALLEITLKRIDSHPLNPLKKKLNKLFEESGVTGAQVAISHGLGRSQTLSFGSCDGKNNVTQNTQFQIASLSKTYACLHSFDILLDHGYSVETKVNEILEKYQSDFKLSSAHGDDVLIRHLMGHCALNMHYVNGIPSSDSMPSIESFLSGNSKYGYDEIKVIHKPGKKFSYSGAGFILLEYLISLITDKKLDEINPQFSHRPLNDNYAKGFSDQSEQIDPAGYKMFPSFAAGMWSRASDVNHTLESIAYAYHNIEGSEKVSHDCAVNLLYGVDKGCKLFMNSLIGLGVFTIEAGENTFMLHQGANDGFRAIYLYCFKGPDIYKGATIFSNSELKAVILNAKLMQEILKSLDIKGIDYSQFKTNFNSNELSQEEIVNIGYKELVLDAFEESLPEVIEGRDKLSLCSEFNVLRDAKILSVSNQRFARAQNLLSPFQPIFDPTLFGWQGKVMDSWESARHNNEEYDHINLRLIKATDINYISISTKYHDGNQVEWIEIYSDGELVLDKTKLDGHALRKIKLDKTLKNCTELHIRVYPDGGLSRLGAYETLPEDVIPSFKTNDQAQNIRYLDEIPMVTKPLGPDPLSYQSLNLEKRKNYASLAHGAKVISSTDEHYAPAINVLSPYPPLNMFDGLESKRSRILGHKEELVIRLAKKIKVRDVLFDFTYFVNNNPKDLSIFAKVDGNWLALIENYFCKPYAGNVLSLKFSQDIFVEDLKFNFIPDGGVNRIKVYGSE